MPTLFGRALPIPILTNEAVQSSILEGGGGVDFSPSVIGKTSNTVGVNKFRTDQCSCCLCSFQPVSHSSHSR